MEYRIRRAYDVLRRQAAVDADSGVTGKFTFGVLRQLQHAAAECGIHLHERQRPESFTPSQRDVEQAYAVFLWSMTAYPQS